MALKSEELFLARFVNYNKERYQDNLAFVSQLEQLKVEDINFSNFRKSGNDVDDYAYLVDVESPGLFEGENQRYLPARYTEDGVAVLAAEEQLTEEEIRNKTTPGIYRLVLGDQFIAGAVLVKRGNRNSPAVLALIQENSLFDIETDNITIEEDLTQVTIDSTMIVSKLLIIESKFDDKPRYNGQYRYNGAIRML